MNNSGLIKADGDVIEDLAKSLKITEGHSK